MSVNTEKNCIYRQTKVNELIVMLERLVKAARKGNFTQAEHSAGYLQEIVEEVALSNILNKPEYEEQRERIQNLYSQLSIIFSTEKSKIAKDLKTIRDYKKVFNTYKNSLRTSNIK